MTQSVRSWNGCKLVSVRLQFSFWSQTPASLNTMWDWLVCGRIFLPMYMLRRITVKNKNCKNSRSGPEIFRTDRNSMEQRLPAVLNLTPKPSCENLERELCQIKDIVILIGCLIKDDPTVKTFVYMFIFIYFIMASSSFWNGWSAWVIVLIYLSED